MNSQNEYIPGTCNIGPKEIAMRKRASIYAAIFFIGLTTLMLTLQIDKYWRLILFIPAATFGVTFQQWYFKFCVYFGLKGVFNFGDMGQQFTIEQKENYKKDRIKVAKMITLGVLFGLLVTATIYLLP
jgi:Ni/Fe-hydrogenase subunit HybB-like protein